MPSFQLIIREPGKEPRSVPLSSAVVVGRSRRANVTIEDQEVGREQFRIEIQGTTVYVESLGRTNRTRIDESTLDAGTRIALPASATLYAGRTTFQVVAAGATPGESPPADVTMVAPRPAGPGAGPPSTVLPPQEQTGGAVAPMRTMNMGRPGAPRPPSSPGEGSLRDLGLTGPIVPPGRGAPPSDAPAGGGFEQTMQLRGGPGAKPPSRPPTEHLPRPAPPPPPAPPLATPQPAARPAEPPPAGPEPEPKRSKAKPSTVALMPDQILVAAAPGSELAQQALAIESRLHEALPRLVIKSDALKRRVRLMKACTTLGRAEAADVLLPSESVSESHAEIHFDGTNWTLRDCGSTNSSVVDGVQLRGQTHALVRHSLIGIGNLRAIFLYNDRDDAAYERRIEGRAVRALVASGRVTREEGQQAVRLVRSDATLSAAEVLLMETAITPQDWATAVATARSRVTLLDRVRRLFRRKPRQQR
ncbi:MAG TPA: FHA domain-containing protein [Planctomycetota bacterium]|nr:FHA domain-containing protein [Planctomycetota bacterium]